MLIPIRNTFQWAVVRYRVLHGGIVFDHVLFKCGMQICNLDLNLDPD
jgi:hypothetical protein